MSHTLNLLLPLAANISLFVVFSVVASSLARNIRWQSQWVVDSGAGLVFGTGAVLSMTTPLMLADGLMIDGRNVAIAVATVVSGPLTGIICTALAGFYRWTVGGVGLTPAFIGMAMTLALSILFRHVQIRRGVKITAMQLGFVGFLTALANLGGFLFLPEAIDRRAVFELSALPILALTPIGTYGAGALMLWWNQREELKTQLSALNQRLELALKGSQDGVFEYDADKKRMWTSHRYREMRGYELTAANTSLGFWRCLVHPDDRDALDRQFGDLEAGRVDRIDVLTRTYHANGRMLHIRSQAVSEKDEAGNVVRIVGSSSDETRHVEAEGRLRDAIDTLESGFAYYDSDDRLVIYNNGYIDAETVQRVGDPIGRKFEEIMRGYAHDQSAPAAAKSDPDAWLAWRTKTHGDPSKPLEIEWSDGRWFNVVERRTAGGGCVALWTDITRQKQREKELLESRDILERQAVELALLAGSLEDANTEAVTARREAERANREKSRFLASMSHELRTPLNSIIGFSDVIRNEIFGPMTPPRYAEYVSLISHSGTHLLSLINDVLDLSKVEAGHMTISVEVLEAAHLVHHAFELTQEMASIKKVTLINEVTAEIGVLHADERAITQVLLNLVSNAIKFTEPGGRIRLAATRRDDGVLLTVTDSGIGMTPAEVEKALEPYEQIDSPLARKSTGTGLGLPLAKGLVELHGGKLIIASRKGVGTKISALFPWKNGLPQDSRALKVTG